MNKLAVSFVGFAFLTFTPLVAVAGQHEGHEGPSPAASTHSAVFKDPVCGMDVSIKGARYMCEYKKTKYYFCTKDDMDKFKKSPPKYLNNKDLNKK